MDEHLVPFQPQDDEKGPRIDNANPPLDLRAQGPLGDTRELPSRQVTDESIADVYADFILYSNPYYSSVIDTTELKRIFRNPPRSDGKDFSIYRLWELIQRFDKKEIKTWGQLALDLGVEPPSADKGHSGQKVQQYSVRLKVRILSWYTSSCSDVSLI